MSCGVVSKLSEAIRKQVTITISGTENYFYIDFKSVEKPVVWKGVNVVRRKLISRDQQNECM